jgi:lysophospholipase L1-like esterase
MLPAVEVIAEDDAPPLRSVHRIVFLGDSITQGGDYVTDFECWLVARGIRVEVLNLGLASETLSALTESENAAHKSAFGFGRPCLGERLDRVLAETRPDLLVACYGMNDGGSLPADESGVKRFSAAAIQLREKALKAGVKRVVLCTPPVHDARGNASLKSHDENLTRFSTWLLSKKAEGWGVVDLHGPMRRALDQRRAEMPAFAFAADGVHPGREGHWLMARSILDEYLGVNLAGRSSAEQLFKSNGTEIRNLIHSRMTVLFDAWMTRLGHSRPGVPGGPGAEPGPSIAKATARAAEITQRVQGLVRP